MLDWVLVTQHIIKCLLTEGEEVCVKKLKIIMFYLQCYYLMQTKKPCYLLTMINEEEGVYVDKIELYYGEGKIERVPKEIREVSITQEGEVKERVVTYDPTKLKERDKILIERVAKSYKGWSVEELKEKEGREKVLKEMPKGVEVRWGYVEFIYKGKENLLLGNR